ncbi:MAG: 5'/3'-nucleotidase SurE [Deltaproteobacteria bacterium]|nr:5'/3'-nucleotidase SurE [Deltaproteobacteria bacterium]
MKILLTNDDGIYADGLWALFDRLSAKHRVTVIAPDRERSAVGHGITLHDPIRAQLVTVNGGGRGLAVNGTPADCVKLAILEILDHRPDLVVSGINPGANVGVHLNYSGTVSAAKEAALYGIAAIAVSIQGRRSNHYADASAFIERLADRVFHYGLPTGTFLNVNVPDIPLADTAGVRVSRQATSMLSDYFEKRIDPRDQTYYWQGIDTQSGFDQPDTDGAVLRKKHISVTPIKCDMTDYALMDDLEKWEL